MESAVARFSAGEVLQPVRTVLTVGPTQRVLRPDASVYRQPPRLGAKLVTVFNEQSRARAAVASRHDRAARPRHRCAHRADGRPLHHRSAHGRRLGGIGASSVATRRVNPRDHRHRRAGTKPPRGVCRGAHARGCAGLVAHTERAATVSSSDMAGHVAARLEATATAEAAVRGADLIVLATSAPTPVVQHAWVADGAHVVSVGACRPDQREMAPELVARGRLFVDSRAAALVESGDVVMGITESGSTRHIAGELGEVVLGRVPRAARAPDRDDLQVARAWRSRTSSPPIWCSVGGREWRRDRIDVVNERIWRRLRRPVAATLSCPAASPTQTNALARSPPAFDAAYNLDYGDAIALLEQADHGRCQRCGRPSGDRGHRVARASDSCVARSRLTTTLAMSRNPTST